MAPNIRSRELRLLKSLGFTYQELATRFNISPQRVQQLIAKGLASPKKGICQYCKKWSPKLQRHHESYHPEIVALICLHCHGRLNGKEHHKRTVERVKKELSDKSVVSAKEANLVCEATGFHIQTVKKALKELSIGYVSPIRVYPWEKLNWALPTKHLSAIWEIPESQISNRRSFFKMPKRQYPLRSVPDSILEKERKKASTVIHGQA